MITSFIAGVLTGVLLTGFFWYRAYISKRLILRETLYYHPSNVTWRREMGKKVKPHLTEISRLSYVIEELILDEIGRDKQAL